MTVSTRDPENIDANPPLSGNPFGAFVGGDTALTSSDGDGSYVELSRYYVDNVGTVSTTHTFTWTPAGPITPDAVVTVEADWANLAGDGTSFTLGFVHPTLGGRTATQTFVGAAVQTYGVPETQPVSAAWVEDGEAFAPGVQWYITILSALGPGQVLRITRLTMHITTGAGPVPHLRQRNRDDIRARLKASRQRSIRARGYL